MQSAIKAKLIELGSGSSTGYIDDELPDYVMIMVANKRSKVQMMDDLSLFLGKNTEGFVTWLHQVLEKLQQVTLPSNGRFIFFENYVSLSLHKICPILILIFSSVALSKTKRKTSESNDKQKDKKKKKVKLDSKSKTPDRSTTPPPPILNTPAASITDVFADHLIQRAKKSLIEVASVSVKTKNEQEDLGADLQKKTVNDFDIPTISEIAKNAVGEVNRRKEITELAELQRQIDEAKKQLRHMASEDSADDDDDFINLKADGDELDDNSDSAGEKTKKPKKATESSLNSVSDKDKTKRVPITFKDDSRRERNENDHDRNENVRDRNEFPRGRNELPRDRKDNSRDRNAISRDRKENSRDRNDRSRDRNANSRDRNENSRDRNESTRDRIDNARDRYESNRDRNENFRGRRSVEKRPEEKRSEEKEKRSVLERLGTRSTNASNASFPRRNDQQMYVPLYRRNDSGRIDDREKDRSRDKTRENIPRDSRDLRERVRERERDRSDRLSERDRKREKDYDRGRGVEPQQEKPVISSVARVSLQSRVIVAPPKPEYNDDEIEVPINSVVKVQPRPITQQRNQACKNLLLRAMAEAQKSIASVKPPPQAKPSIKDRLSAGLYTKSFRENRLKDKLPKPNFVVQVANGNSQIISDDEANQVIETNDVDEIDEVDEEEYFPIAAHSDTLEYEYIPQSLDEASEDEIT